MGKGELRDQNYANVLLDTRLVDVTLAILDKPSTKAEGVELILELHVLLYANVQCAQKMVNRNVCRDVMGLLDKHKGNKGIRGKVMHIIQQSSKIKANQKKLLEDKVLDKVLAMKPEEEEEELALLGVLGNFTKSEEGVAGLREGQALAKCMEVLVKHPYEEQFNNLGGQVLGKIATQQDLQKALDSVMAEDA